MPQYTYSPAAVLVETTGEFAVGAIGALRPASGGDAVPIWDLNDSALPSVVVGPKGAHQAFKADIPSGILDFGSVMLPAVSDEARVAGLDAQTEAAQAVVIAQNAESASSAAVAAAASKYAKPGTGIPETDLSAAVQTKLNDGGTGGGTGPTSELSAGTGITLTAGTGTVTVAISQSILNRITALEAGGGGGTTPTTAFTHTSEGASLTTEWTSETDTANQLSLSTAAAAIHQGAKGIAIVNTAATPAFVTKSGLTTTGTTWRYDFWVKAATGWGVGDTFNDMILCQLADGTGNLLNIWLDGARRITAEVEFPAFTRFADRVSPLTVDTWTKMSLRFTGGGTASGAIEVLKSDAVIATAATRSFTGRWRPTTIKLGAVEYKGTAVTPAGTLYLDDGVVTS